MLVPATTSNPAATSGVPRPKPSKAAANRAQGRGSISDAVAGSIAGASAIPGSGAPQPQPNGEAVERVDSPIEPVRCCHRAPGQRQRTKAQPLAEDMIEGEGPGALRHKIGRASC